jgi:diguanylate cyclase (GGDEF)-like protein/PAS domain S-box-containing protein
VARAFNLMVDRVEAILGELRESEERLASAHRLARLASWGVEPGSLEIRASDQFRRIYGFAPTGLSITRNVLLERIHPHDRERFAAAFHLCLREGTPFSLDHRTVEIDGAERMLHSQGKGIPSEDGVVRVVGTVQDITERKLMEDQVRYLAYHDSLTGLGNRRLFKAHLNLSIQRACSEGLSVGVLFIDLDSFKLINDTLGHSTGDQVLREIAARLIKTVRTSDIMSRSVGEQSPPIVARLGGDEFTVVLPDIEGPEEAGRVARRILRWLSEPFQLQDYELAITGSIGIATWPSDGKDVEVLLRNCDTAMYHAKAQGRNNYQFYSESMNAVVFKRLMMENKLRKALEQDEIELQYQPKVDVATGRVAGLEALARWRDPELGIVSPAEFIPMAEETGLIDAIGEWVLWGEEGLSDLRLSVNLSGHQLRDDTFVRRVAHVLDGAGVNPRRLDLEITETALMMEEDAVIESLQNLRNIGVSISLDDFGTGYSSLSYLRRLPVDTLKIDRSFIRAVDTDPDDAALVGAIVSMARVLRLRVAVEGVETKRQLELLQEVGCDEVQGHLLSPPVLAADVRRTVQEIDRRKRAKPRVDRTRRGPT